MQFCGSLNTYQRSFLPISLLSGDLCDTFQCGCGSPSVVPELDVPFYVKHVTVFPETI